MTDRRRRALSRWMPTPCRRSRAGQVLWTILLLLAMLAVLAYAVQGMMVEFHVQSHRLALEAGAQALALSGLAGGGARSRAELAPGGRLYEKVLAGESIEGSLKLDLTNEIAVLTATYPGSTLDVSVQVGAPKTLAGASVTDDTEKTRLRSGRGWDPREVRMPVTLTAVARWGDAKRTLVEVREAAVVDVAPGTLGKFTLWAKHLTPANADGFACGFDGQAGGRGAPLVLNNGGAAPEEAFSRDPLVYKKRGHVYLGGDQALKVSAGYLGLGEAWTFLPMEELSAMVLAGGDAKAPPVYVDGDPPDFFMRTYPPPGKTPPPFQRFEIRHMMTGFYAGPDERGRTLAQIFPAEAAAAGPSYGDSSRLHLFGTAEVPSPTLVLGRVRRRYPSLSAVLVDAEEDGKPDGLVGILPQLEGEFPAGMPVIPATVPSLDGGPGIPVDAEAEIKWDNMFGDGTYPTFNSQIEDRPYMDAYSFLYRTDDGTRSFYPDPALFPSFVEDLALGEIDAPFYHGRPEGLTGEDLIEKATWTVADGQELADRFTTNGILALGGVVEVRAATGGTLTLSGVEVRRGGMIVLSGPGDIELTHVKFADALEQPLILVAMEGSVKIARGDDTDPLPVSVIAPRGRLTTTGSGPLALGGTVAVDTLDLDQVPDGGDLYYDTRLDPTGGATKDRYRVLFSDASTQW